VQIEKEMATMRRELFSYNESVKALQKGYAIELHYWGYDLIPCEPGDTWDYEFVQLPMQVYICHRLRDFPNPYETFQAIGGYWGEGVEARVFAIPKLQSQR
jgi:hypothetical protein